MWTAAAGATAQSQNLDAIANNLANSDSVGFKKEVPTFKEYLSVVERQQAPMDIPRGPIKDKDFYPLDGRDQSLVIMDGTHTIHEQGNMRVTNGQFDVAIDGPGFLEISTPAGLRYTRQGSMKINPDGRLVTTEGHPILSAAPGGLAGTLNPQTPNDVASRYISLRDKGTRFTINNQGEIYAGEDLVGKLSLAEFKDMRKLKKNGGQVFENVDPTNREPALQTIVRQGLLETSNVNPIEEMTNMIKANRLFEQDLKALKTYGDLMGREVNDIGKL
jgi:flagellar basal-body rod protein FlgF